MYYDVIERHYDVIMADLKALTNRRELCETI